MKKQTFTYLVIAIILLIPFGSCLAQDKRVGEGVVLRPQRTDVPPVLDGVLDDPAWKSGPIVSGPFITNTPVYGEELPQKTEIWLSYDSKNIYVAYYCHDDHPEKIRGTMTRRDNIMAEDWIDVDIDTFGTRQLSYLHACNPLGVQCDLVYSASGGQSLDPDWVWYSAGKMVADGYIVELRIPLKSLRYKGGKSVTMNIGFYRYVSHSDANASWPQEGQKLGYFNSLVPVVFEDLDNQLRLEALPVITYSSVRDRQSPQAWYPADDSLQAGLDLKYGVSPTSNLELTVNPDFSQVESDQMQVTVNQRYPIFFSEKRPFFMEVGNLFSLAGAVGAGNMASAVHTRTIIDPAWGAKFTGDFSRFSLGILAAGDEALGQNLEEDNPDYGRNATSVIARGKYLLGGDNFIGMLYSGWEFADSYNRVVAADSHFRLAGRHSIDLNGMFSFSGEGDGSENRNGHALNFSYAYVQRPLEMYLVLEDYSPDFRMDSAFYNRTGFSCAAFQIAPRFYPQWKGMSWLRRANLIGSINYIHDKTTGGDDLYLSAGIQINTLRQGSASLQFIRNDEFWAGRGFVQSRVSGNFTLTPKPWLTFNAGCNYGEAINYQNAYMGLRLNLSAGLALQLGSRLRQSFNYTYQDFHRADDRSHVYDINILVSRTTFQYNKSLFFRSLIQYDSYNKRVLTDLLASFTLIPGTVLHVGYGLMHNEYGYENGTWKRDIVDAEYFNMRQSFFAKVSYRWQF